MMVNNVGKSSFYPIGTCVLVHTVRCGVHVQKNRDTQICARASVCCVHKLTI